MNISNPLSRLYYSGKWYVLLLWSKAFDSNRYLRYETRKQLREAAPDVRLKKGLKFGSPSVAAAVAALVLLTGSIFLFATDAQLSGVSDQMRRQVSSYVNVLWQVQTGLLSVGFVVIVLLIQVLSGRDQLSGYVFMEYVKRSGVLTVAWLGLSSIAVMGATALSLAGGLSGATVSVPAVAFNSILLAINLIAVGFLYWQIVHFIRPGHGVTLTAELVKRNLQRDFYRLVLEAYAERLLIAVISTTKKIDYKQSLPRQGSPKEVEYPIENVPMQVVDVDLYELKRLSKALGNEDSTGPNGWIRAKIGTTLSFTNPHVGYLQSGATDSDAKRLIDCFVVEEVTDEDAGWEASAKELKNRAIRAVTGRRSSELSDWLDVYVDTLRHYTRYVQRYDSQALSIAFDDPLALNEHWRPDKKLYRDFRDISRRAVKEDDRNLAREVVYLPIRVMRFAQSQKNPDLFHQFAGAYVQLYTVAHSLPGDSDARRLVLKRSWRHLRDYARRLSFRYLDRPDRAQEIIENATYAVLILRVFNRLMKRALDLRDENSFLTFVEKFKSVLEDLSETRMRLRTERLRIQQSINEDTSSEDENTGSDEEAESIQQLEEAEEAVDEVLTTRALIQFGISAWVLDLYQRDELDKTQMDQLIAEASDNSQFDTPKELYQLYMDALDAEWDNQFRWDIWDDARHDRGDGMEFGAVTTKNWLRHFYVVQGLRIVQPGESEANLPPSTKLRTELGKLRDTCQSIIENGHPIRELDDIKQRKDTFIRLHKEALRKQEEKKTDQLIQAELDQDRVEAYKEAFLNHWMENSIDSLLAPFTAVEVSIIDEEETVQGSEPPIRVPLQPKEPFTDRGHGSIAPRMGKRNGQEMGRVERKLLAKALQRELPTEENPKEHLTTRIEEILEDGDFEADLLLIGERTMVSDFLLPSEEFVAEHREKPPKFDLPGYQGRFGDVPVCSTGTRDKCALAVDSDSLSVRRLVQKENRPFQIEVGKIANETAQKLLDESTSLQQEDESRGEATRRLQQRVLIECTGNQIDIDVDEESGIVLVVEAEEK